MNEELDAKLVAAHPSIFRDRNGEPMKTLMVYGFPGDGWYKLLDDLCTKIDEYVKQGHEPVVAFQVKEKFGTLRFYCSGSDPHIAKLVSEAEALSEQTCEYCGEPGELRESGWLKVRCDACEQKRDQL